LTLIFDYDRITIVRQFNHLSEQDSKSVLAPLRKRQS